MEPNIIQNAVESMAPDSLKVATPGIKKPKGPIAIAIICSILAIAGVGFGVYGMFFSSNNDAQKDCEQTCNSQAPEADDSFEATMSSSEVAALLEEKYNFHSEESTFSDGMAKYIDDYNQSAKIIFTIQNSENELSEPQVDSANAQLIRSINYEDLNNNFKFYFGNDSDIEKQDYEFNAIGLIKMTYSPDSDSFDVYYRDGIGGFSTVMQYNKVVDVTGTKDGFYATVVSVTIDNVVRKEASEFFGPSILGDTEYYEIGMSEDDINSIKDSLGAYKFNFIEEDGEYKLASIEKL